MLSVLTRIWNFLMKIIHSSFFKVLKNAITFVEAIKVAVSGKQELQEALEELFGKNAEQIEKYLIVFVKVIESLGLGLKCLEFEKPIDVAMCFVKWYREQPKTIRDSLHSRIAVEITKLTADKPVKEHEAYALVNIAYAMQKNNLMRENEIAENDEDTGEEKTYNIVSGDNIKTEKA